jgi:flagellar biosynthesis protein FlhF
VIIKKFQANTETEAIMLAKEEMGKNAIVMNIKTIEPKGIYKLFRKSLVEITAAVDDNLENVNGESAAGSTGSIQKSVRAADRIYNDSRSDILSGSQSYKDKQEQSAIELKLNNLQSLLEKQLSEKQVSEKQVSENEDNEKKELQNQEGDKKLTCIQLIYNQLVSNEVDEKYANQIISEIDKNLKKDVTVDNILASIYQKIILKLGQPKTIGIYANEPRFIFFIGSTGVGKTTTIAKISSKFKVEDKAKVAYLTADTYRIAAVEQLRTYANILGIPMKVIYSEEDMKQAIEEFSDYDIVFVDTAGRSHRNKEQRDDLERLLETVPEDRREIYLVLSAATKYRDLVKTTEAYAEVINYNLIFSKMDETSSIGNILNIRMLTGAPLSYVTYGQNVPDDITRIDAQSIAKQLLRGQ